MCVLFGFPRTLSPFLACVRLVDDKTGHQQQVLTDQYTANARSKVKKACQVFDPYNTGRMDVEQFRSIFLKCALFLPPD